jgi:hypothetical protein
MNSFAASPTSASRPEAAKRLEKFPLTQGSHAQDDGVKPARGRLARSPARFSQAWPDKFRRVCRASGARGGLARVSVSAPLSGRVKTERARLKTANNAAVLANNARVLESSLPIPNWGIGPSDIDGGRRG